jgi:hypothetical protein
MRSLILVGQPIMAAGASSGGLNRSNRRVRAGRVKPSCSHDGLPHV